MSNNYNVMPRGKNVMKADGTNKWHLETSEEASEEAKFRADEQSSELMNKIPS